MLFGKSGYLGILLCRADEHGLGDHMAIKGHDGPTRDLLSLNNIQIYLNSYVVGVVWSLTQNYIQTLPNWVFLSSSSS